MEITGWDISSANLYEAAKRAQVLEPDLINKLKEKLQSIVPLKTAFNPEFVASNQSARANNVLEGSNSDVIEHLRKDIQGFKRKVDKVVILWTANTEVMYSPEIEDLGRLEEMIASNASLPASILFAYAACKEKVLYLNGSPQNTFQPAIMKLAEEEGAYLGGSDFKSG